MSNKDDYHYKDFKRLFCKELAALYNRTGEPLPTIKETVTVKTLQVGMMNNQPIISTEKTISYKEDLPF